MDLRVFGRVRRTGIVFLALLLCLACTNPPGPSGATKAGAKAGGKLYAASWLEQNSMLDAGITAASQHAVADEAPMVEGLLGLTSTADLPKSPKLADFFQPQLATEVPTIENGDVRVSGSTMAVTYKLRHGVQWSDGQPFTAKDVVDTVNFFYLKFKDNNPTQVFSTSGWDQISSVTTPDDYTAVVNYKSVYGPYLTNLAGPYGVLPSHLLQQSWSAGGDLTRTKLAIDNTPANPAAYKGTDTWDKWLVGTGPFVFKEWVPGDHLTMVKNNLWWGTHKAYLDEITLKFEPDPNAQLADLRTSTIDLGLDFRATLLSPLAHLPNVTTVVLPDSGAEKLDLNLKNKYLADLTIRKAINMSIDKQRMVDTLLEGRTTVPPDSWICIGLSAWCADPSVPTTKYDPAGAKRLLDDAGYKVQTSGTDRGYRAFKDGTTISINLVTTSGNTLREQQEVQIGYDLQAIGIKVPMPFKNPTAGKLYGAYAALGVLFNHAFDMAMYTNMAPGGEPDYWYGAYVCDQIPTPANGGVGQNDVQECNPAVDAAFKAGRNTVSQTERKQAYVNAQKALATDLPEIPLYQHVTVNAYNNKLGGYKGNVDVWLNNTGDWYLIGGS
jgi:peptide/nickel transport system substrate-binding protein